MNKQLKILIADDNKIFCKFVKIFLEKIEYINIIGVVNNDEDEIEAIEKYTPDIVITDLMRDNSYKTAEIIRKYNNINFLIISANYSQICNLYLNNIIGVIRKPFSDYNIILNKINEFII